MGELVRMCSHCEDYLVWVNDFWLCRRCDSGGIAQAPWDDDADGDDEEES